MRRPDGAPLPSPTIAIPPSPDLDALAGLLNDSRRVTLFCGRGCAGAIDQAAAAARFIAAPEHEKMHDERLWDLRRKRDREMRRHEWADRRAGR